MALVSFITLVVIGFLLVRNIRRVPLALAGTLLYVLLTMTLGTMVWEARGGHTKAICPILVIGLFLLVYEKGMLLRFVLAAQVVIGLDAIGQTSFFSSALQAAPFLLPLEMPVPLAAGAPENPLLHDLRSHVEWLEPQTTVRREYDGLYNRVHRELKLIRIAVTNNTDQTWHPGRGKHPVQLGYLLFRGDRCVVTRMWVIDKPIAPGETEEFTIHLELRRRGDYRVLLSLYQDGNAWFCQSDPAFGTSYTFRVE